jgi:hypothetical protein
VSAVLDQVFTLRGFGILVAVCCPILGWLIGPGVWTRMIAGYVDLHWSRVVLAGLIAFGLGQLLITVLIVNLVRFHVERGTARETNERAINKSAQRTLLAGMSHARLTGRVPRQPQSA